MAYDDLGELQDTQTISRRFLFSAFVLWLGTLIAFFFLLHLLYTPAAIARDQRRATTVVCALSGLACLFFGYALSRHRGASLAIYSGGLEMVVSGRRYRFRWDDVQYLTLKVTARTVNGIRAAMVHEYTLHLVDGRKVAIPSGLRDVEQLGQRLEREVYPRAASRAFERLRRNESVTFGPCKISNHGLEMNGTVKAWKELEPITLTSGQFTVRKRGGQTWRVLAFSEIPNAPVFLQLTQSLRQAS
jgi:hypothetical protein